MKNNYGSQRFLCRRSRCNKNYKIPYQLIFSQSLKELEKEQMVCPGGFEIESISTCGDYIAVASKSTDTTNLIFSNTIIDLESDKTHDLSGTQKHFSQVAVPH
jgi:hypothetical protein